MAYSCVRVQFEIGHEASIRNKRTPEGFTHDWEVFVRGADNAEIHHFVEKVVFHLHDTFPKPKRTFKEPPYCVKESGYAGFNLAIDIYFKTREEGSRKLRLYYDLTLQPSGPRISNVTREQTDFTNPPEDFRRKLIKGGGIGIGNDGTSASSDKSSHNNNLLPSSLGDETKGLNPPKSKSSNPSDLPKKHKPKENTKIDEPRLTNSFADLFGPPIKTGKHSPNPKPQSKTSESKNHEKQNKEKESKSVKPSPLKEKDRDKNDKEKENSSNKKEKEEKSSSKDKDRGKDKEGSRDKEKLKDKSSKKSSSPSVLPKETVKKEENSKRLPPFDDTPPPVKDKLTSKIDVKPEKKHKEKKNREERERKEKHKEHEKKEMKEKDIEKEKVLERVERKIEPPKEAKEVKVKEKLKMFEREDKKVKKLEKEKERNHEAEKQKHKHKKKDKHKNDEKEKTKKKEKSIVDKSPLERDVKMKIKTPPSVKKESPPPSPPPSIASKPLNQLILEMSDKDTDSDFSGSGDDDLKTESSERSGQMVPSAAPPPPPLPPPPQIQPTTAPVKIKPEMKGDAYMREERTKKKKEKTRDDEREGKKRKKKNKEKDEPPEKQSKIDIKEEHERSPSPEEDTLFTDDYVTQLKDLQHKIMTLQDNADLQKVVQVISETGQFEITQRTFDFDLCALDPSTVKRLQDMFIAASS